MANDAKSPLSGAPKTIQDTFDGDIERITVYAAALTPIRARLSDWVSTATGCIALIGAILAALQTGEAPIWQFGALAAAPVLAFFGSRMALYHLLRKSVRVVFTPDEFVIHGLFRTRRFDRNMPHKFALYSHDKAKREAEIIRFRVSGMKRSLRLFPPKHYLGASFHLSFEYLDQRNDILTIYRLKDAHRIIARLKACDTIMDGYAHKGTGQALTPEQDWSPQPGGLSIQNR